MKQKLEDLKLLIKNDRRVMFAGGLLIVVALLYVLTAKPPRRRRVVAARPSVQSTGAREAYKDLTLAMRQDIDKNARKSKEQTALLKRIQSDFEEHRTRSTSIFETLLDQFEHLKKAVNNVERSVNSGRANLSIDNASGRRGRGKGGGRGRNVKGGKGGSSVDRPGQFESPNKLVGFGFNEVTVPLPPKPPKPLRTTVVTTGDAVTLTLLTGVIAPTDGTPYPVVFKLTGPIRGPDGSTLDLGEARIIAAASGSEADGRVLFRLTDMALRHKDGRRSVVPVDGWILGEDGIRGMKGKLIDKLGRLIVATAGVSFTAAIGDSLLNDASSISVRDSDNIDIDSNDLNIATVSALTDASSRIGGILLDRYEKLVPAVEVLPNRQVTAIFSQSVEIEVIDDEFDREGIYASALD